MKHKALIGMLLLFICVSAGGCATQAPAPSESLCEMVYTDIAQDSTESLKQNLNNNLSISPVQ